MKGERGTGIIGNVLEAGVARTCSVGPRLVPYGQGKAADLQNRSALPFSFNLRMKVGIPSFGAAVGPPRLDLAN